MVRKIYAYTVADLGAAFGRLHTLFECVIHFQGRILTVDFWTL